MNGPRATGGGVPKLTGRHQIPRADRAKESPYETARRCLPRYRLPTRRDVQAAVVGLDEETELGGGRRRRRDRGNENPGTLNRAAAADADTTANSSSTRPDHGHDEHLEHLEHPSLGTTPEWGLPLP